MNKLLTYFSHENKEPQLIPAAHIWISEDDENDEAMDDSSW